MEKILIIGNGGHAKSLMDAIEQEERYRISGLVVNDEKEGSLGYPIIGKDENLEEIYKDGIEYAAMGIGYLGRSVLREEIYKKLKSIGFKFPVICDPSAIISEHIHIGEGSFIGKGAIVNADVSIGKMCIINSGSIIEHDCKIFDYSHISVGSILCGGVNVGRASFVGANATVIQMTKIGENCMIGAGTVICKDVEDGSMVYGGKTTLVGG